MTALLAWTTGLRRSNSKSIPTPDILRVKQAHDTRIFRNKSWLGQRLRNDHRAMAFSRVSIFFRCFSRVYQGFTAAAEKLLGQGHAALPILRRLPTTSLHHLHRPTSNGSVRQHAHDAAQSTLPIEGSRDAPRTGSAGAWPNLGEVVPAGVRPAQSARLSYLRGVL